MSKVAITVSIEKEDLLKLLKLAREKHQTPQNIIRALINKLLKKQNYVNEQNNITRNIENNERP